MSLKSSILSRPMGVSPMLMSIKTIGLVVVVSVDEDIGVDGTKKRVPNWSQTPSHLGANVASRHPPHAH